MSGWRAFVVALVADPDEAKSPRENFSSDAAPAAMRLGLVTRIAPGRYKPTDLGREFVAGRVTLVERTGTGSHGRQGRFLAATWLRALPSGVTMDKRPPRAAVSEWGGLPS